jgi:hypothetical protein
MRCTLLRMGGKGMVASRQQKNKLKLIFSCSSASGEGGVVISIKLRERERGECGIREQGRVS